MIDTINSRVIHDIAATLRDHVPDEADIHTVTITLNGAHGGVDVTALTFVGDGPDISHKWIVQ